MKILQISTLYNKGGAGIFAKNLHEYINKYIDGHESTFLYSYSDKGLIKSNNNNKNVLSITPHYAPYLNYISHNLIGIDLFGVKDENLFNLLKCHDIVHIHIIHSHGFNYRQLFKQIIALNKPVIVTLHDSWFYTGRCAIINECQNWSKGCGKCELLNNYPSSLFDFSKQEFHVKTKLINKINNLQFVSISNWISENIQKVYSSHKHHKIKNAINTQQYLESTYNISPEQINILIVTHDFQDPMKIDHDFLIKLSQEQGITLHLVGVNDKYNGSNIVNYGYVSDVSKLLRIYFSCDIFLFFSKIDNYPTVLMEALCSGMKVCHYSSKGASEICQNFDTYEIKSYEKFIKYIKNNKEVIKNINYKNSIKLQACDEFSYTNMIRQYIKVYEDA